MHTRYAAGPGSNKFWHSVPVITGQPEREKELLVSPRFPLGDLVSESPTFSQAQDAAASLGLTDLSSPRSFMPSAAGPHSDRSCYTGSFFMAAGGNNGGRGVPSDRMGGAAGASRQGDGGGFQGKMYQVGPSYGAGAGYDGEPPASFKILDQIFEEGAQVMSAPSGPMGVGLGPLLPSSKSVSSGDMGNFSFPQAPHPVGAGGGGGGRQVGGGYSHDAMARRF